jgi:hypothetical protein
MKLTAFSFLFFLLTSPPADVNLQYQFKVGDRYEYVQESKQTTKQSFPGMGDVNMEAVIAGTMEMAVVELTQQGAKFEAKYSALKMNINSVIMAMSMDSNGDQEENSNKIMKAMMNKPFYFFMNTNGVVEKVEGTENLYSGFNDIGLDKSAVEATRKALSQTLNDESVATILTNGFVTYPGKKVKQGDTWKTESKQVVSFPINFQSNWSLSKLEGKNANVTSSSTITTVDKDKVISLNGMKAKSDMSGTQTVDGSVDVTTGWPTTVKVDTQLKGNMTLLAGGMIPQDMVVPMDMKIVTTYTIKKK